MSVTSMKYEYVIDLSIPDMWTPEEHELFSKKFRSKIRATLLAARAGANQCTFPLRPVHPRFALECLCLKQQEDNIQVVRVASEEDDEYDEDYELICKSVIRPTFPKPYVFQPPPRSSFFYRSQEEFDDDTSFVNKRRRF